MAHRFKNFPLVVTSGPKSFANSLVSLPLSLPYQIRIKEGIPSGYWYVTPFRNYQLISLYKVIDPLFIYCFPVIAFYGQNFFWSPQERSPASILISNCCKGFPEAILTFPYRLQPFLYGKSFLSKGFFLICSCKNSLKGVTHPQFTTGLSDMKIISQGFSFSYGYQ